MFLFADYFNEVKQRTSQFDSLHGDFFVYSDIFSEGRPAYWSGYFTTRPFMKQLARELEAQLRGTEILYTISLNQGKQAGHEYSVRKLESFYPELIAARRNLGLFQVRQRWTFKDMFSVCNAHYFIVSTFQHHDAITGTAKQFVMHDYGIKLYEGIQIARKIQKHAMQYLMSHNPNDHLTSDVLQLKEDFQRKEYYNLPVPIAAKVG